MLKGGETHSPAQPGEEELEILRSSMEAMPHRSGSGMYACMYVITYVPRAKLLVYKLAAVHTHVIRRRFFFFSKDRQALVLAYLT